MQRKICSEGMVRLALAAAAALAMAGEAAAFLPTSLPTSNTGRGAAAVNGASALRCADKRVQIITDIDDTVKSSGGVRLLGRVGPALGGIDTQYKRNDFYPGVFQFGAEVANFGKPANLPPAPVAVLTARARELKVFLALKPKTKLVVAYRKAAEDLYKTFGVGEPNWGVDCENTVLYGSVAEWIVQSRKGWRKFDNFKKLREQNDGRTEYVLVGDTGEQDQQCGEWMARDYPDEVRGLFFHKVDENEWPDKTVLLPADTQVNGVPVLFFRTYVGAARKAFETELIGAKELIRVVNTAQEELSGVDKSDLKWSDLSADVDLAVISLGQALKPQAPAGGKTEAAVQAGAASSSKEIEAGPDAPKKKSWFRRVVLRQS